MLKVLFVFSGNSTNFSIAPFIEAQGRDLISNKIKVDFFPIKGKGIKGYLKNIPKLRMYIKQNNYDLIHAHYVLSAWVAVLSFTNKRIIGSFMGSDTQGDVNKDGKRTFLSYKEIILAKLIQPFLSKIIVKSQNLKKYIYLKDKCEIVPNGVNLNNFKVFNYQHMRKSLDFDPNKKYILFLGDKNNPIKNFNLVLESFQKIQNKDIELISPFPVSHNDIIKYLNASNVLAFSSYLEGSPNVIKEAMACNIPIVSTSVGDVEWLFGDEPGYFISDYDTTDFSNKLKDALEFSRQQHYTNGRKRILDLKLDSTSIAKKIIAIYHETLYTTE